jgi:hypothetical protein
LTRESIAIDSRVKPAHDAVAVAPAIAFATLGSGGAPLNSTIQNLSGGS